jgi:hypothetical protein
MEHSFTTIKENSSSHRMQVGWASQSYMFPIPMLFLSCELKKPGRGKGNLCISSILIFFGKAIKKLGISQFIVYEMSHSANILSRDTKKLRRETIFS